MRLFDKAVLLQSLAEHLPASLKAQLKRVGRRLGSQSRSYARWLGEFDTLSELDRLAIARHIEKFEYRPLISVVMPTYETPHWALREAIDSVRGQLYPNWELCVADDASPSPHVIQILRSAALEDRRIKWMEREENGNISTATNSALSLASGEFVALMDHDDIIAPHALYEVAVALNNNPSLDVIYSDEDQIDRKGRRHSPHFKTSWNIELLLGYNMISHLGVYRRALVERLGGFRTGFEGSQDYDLALRCVDATSADRIHHIPSVLYHWRRDYGSDSFSERRLKLCSDAAQRAIGEHLHRRGEAGVVGPHPTLPQWSRVSRPVPLPAPLVSLIVPMRDRADLLERCVRGLLDHTDYPNVEVIMVDHEGKSPDAHRLLEQLRSDTRVRSVPCMGMFNYSAFNNIAVAQSRGSIVGLIDSKIQVINANWLAEMVSLATLPGLGAVGAKLLYPDDMVQHGGIVLGLGAVASHLGNRLPRQARGYFGRNQLTSSVSAVTAACLIVKKLVYEEVGGLDDKHLPAVFNDVDFCLRVSERGYRNIWTPHAELYHHGSSSRSFDIPSDQFQAEIEYMRGRWTNELKSDPFYNDNFSLSLGRDFELAFPPRCPKPWR
ncbi:glycosyltransferase family 2 protein [Bradyrhizobium genosp. P]|uniref:glycosyltransferase family 2 protein n=1 Tax=Bradyrhizobium genosp. P TaxID=83641 RepID=UPI003CE88931